MTVVSNTSPVNYLVLIDLQDVLPALFGRVLVPNAVLQELRSPAAPPQVKNWLDAGEREAIALAQSAGASLVLAHPQPTNHRP